MEDEPNLSYEEAEAYFASHFKWHLHRKTFKTLGEHAWVAKVTTLFRVARGEPEESTFYYLYGLPGGYQHFSLEKETLLPLRDWLNTQLEEGYYAH